MRATNPLTFDFGRIPPVRCPQSPRVTVSLHKFVLLDSAVTESVKFERWTPPNVYSPICVLPHACTAVNSSMLMVIGFNFKFLSACILLITHSHSFHLIIMKHLRERYDLWEGESGLFSRTKITGIKVNHFFAQCIALGHLPFTMKMDLWHWSWLVQWSLWKNKLGYGMT